MYSNFTTYLYVDCASNACLIEIVIKSNLTGVHLAISNSKFSNFEETMKLSRLPYKTESLRRINYYGKNCCGRISTQRLFAPTNFRFVSLQSFQSTESMLSVFPLPNFFECTLFDSILLIIEIIVVWRSIMIPLIRFLSIFLIQMIYN